MSDNKTNKKRKREDDIPNKSIETLSDLIQLSFSNEKYENICIEKLKVIRKDLIELNNLSGLQDIKQSILEQILYYIQNLHVKSEDYLHTLITGPPGVGKTTVAKILGKIFSKIGILSDSKFVIARRDNLVAGYLGQTALKTQKLLESTQGGVLFIDEVYSLGNPKTDGDSFSKEAIDTINLFLSEYKDDFMMIVAGYEKEVEECFFAHNNGLRRRFIWHHKIENYNKDELSSILRLKIRKSGWRLDDEITDEYLSQVIDDNKFKFEYNGGDIENFFCLCKIQHSRRVVYLKPQDKKKINKQDIEKSITKFKSNLSPKNDEPPPFMYI